MQNPYVMSETERIERDAREEEREETRFLREMNTPMYMGQSNFKEQS